MASSETLDLSSVPDLLVGEDGQCALGPRLVELERRLQRLFTSWAREFSAREHLFSPTLPARELQKIDYLSSFPHLATFAVALDPADANLARFVEGGPLGADGCALLTDTSPARHVLNPAACYHFYVALAGQQLDAPFYGTTCAQCFRREAHFRPLERQSSFSMREIVCVGSSHEVQAFLARGRALVDRATARIALPFEWKPATDPFFRPQRSAKLLLQKLEPVKHEMVFQDRLAIGSANFHRNFMGEAFDIRRGGEPAFSGCIAFGVERWISAVLHHYGVAPSTWPDLEGA